MKKFGFDPFVLLEGGGGLDDGGDVPLIGGGSGQGSNPTLTDGPCNYQYWVENIFSSSLDAMGDGPDYYDFGDWWISNHFTLEQWRDYTGLSDSDFYEYTGTEP